MIFFVLLSLNLIFPTNSDSNKTRSGSFIEIEHEAEGTVTVTQENNTLEIKFSADFETDEGPDLFVMLTSAADEHNDADQQVARLEKFEGSQTYRIQNIALKKFNYVQIWCKEYDVVFSSAKLSD